MFVSSFFFFVVHFSLPFNLFCKKQTQSLRAHLINTRDPQLGTIMRCVDESLIYHFMEKYQGFSMTVQAILSLVGNSLGTHILSAAIPNEDGEVEEDEADEGALGYNYYSDGHEGSPYGGAGVGAGQQGYRNTDRITSRVSSQLAGRRQIPNVDFDDSRHNTPAAVGSTTASGRKATSPGHNRALLDSTSSVASIKKLTRSRGAESRDSLSGGGRSGSVHGSNTRTGISDAVTGISPRRYRADRPLSPASTPCWGGGFRAAPTKAGDAHSPNKPLAPISGTRPASLPSHSKSGQSGRFSPTSGGDRQLRSAHQQTRSTTNSRGGSVSQPQSLVLFGSENLRRTAEEMGFTPNERGGEADFNDEIFNDQRDDLDADANSVFSHNSVASKDSYHTSVPSNAIAAMHEQLVEENILPSLQPEIVLSQSQIEELGLHKKTFNQIMQEISKHGSFHSAEGRSGGGSVDLTDTALLIRTPHLSHYGGGGGTANASAADPPISDSLPNSPKTPTPVVVEKTIPTSGNLNKVVANLMTASTVVKSLFVQPLSDTVDVPPPPKSYISLYGSVYTDADKERFQHLGAMEIARAEQRYGIEPTTSGGFSRSHARAGSNSPDSRLPKLGTLTKPPIAIKTKPGAVDEQNQPMPMNPYPSYEEQSRIQNTGVPAGAGYMLWRPRYRVSREGRYRAGQSHTKLRHSVSSGPVKKPFVSSA